MEKKQIPLFKDFYKKISCLNYSEQLVKSKGRFIIYTISDTISDFF